MEFELRATSTPQGHARLTGIEEGNVIEQGDVGVHLHELLHCSGHQVVFKAALAGNRRVYSGSAALIR